MTACTNHGGKARRVVTAALVGVLSVGTVPMVALAEGVSDGIQQMALTPAEAFANGDLAAENGQGEAVTFPEKDDVSFAAGTDQYLLPTSITIEGSTIDFDLSAVNGNATVLYYVGADDSTSAVAFAGKEDGTTTGLTNAAKYNWTAGTYYMKVTYHSNGSTYDGQSKGVVFKVVDTDLTKAVVFNASDNNKDTTVDSFTYNGKAQKVGLAVDGMALDASEDYDIIIVKGSTAVTPDDDTVIDAGDYVVNVYKHGGASTSAPVKSIPLTVAKLDLSTASVSISDTTDATAVHDCTADGVILGDGSGSAGYVANHDGVKITVNASGSSLPNGVYTATVEPNNDDQFNVTGKATVTFNQVDDVVLSTSFKYAGTPFANVNGDGTLKVDLSDPTTLYSEKKVAVYDVTDTDELDAKAYDIWYTDDEGNEATAADLQTLGTWKVNVRVNAERNNYLLGSDTETLTVKVTGGEVAENDVVFKYNGEVCGDLSNLTYSGKDVLDSLETVVRSGDKTLVEGTDYTVKVVKYGTTDEVDQIVDAGKYTVSIESDDYDLSNAGDLSIDITVKPVDIQDAIYAKSDLMQTFGNTVLIPYTGEEIDPSFAFGYYTDENGSVVDNIAYVDPSNESKYTWNELPAGTVTVDKIEYSKNSTATSTAVDALKDEGLYTLTVSLGKGVKNYDLTGSDTVRNAITVSSQGVFADVPNDAWYSQVVYTAKMNKYINGYAGTMLFGPERSITRADVACILFNMGGGNVTVGSDLWDENISFVTKFDDVDKNAYYAQAVGWASRFGIVNGYNGEFRPTDEITREEFASMLANYAKAMGDDITSDGSALAALPDANTVSDWAEANVAWAVENGIMGNGGSVNATSNITRAEVAAMAVNYQPEPLTSGFLGGNPSRA